MFDVLGRALAYNARWREELPDPSQTAALVAPLRETHREEQAYLLAVVTSTRQLCANYVSYLELRSYAPLQALLHSLSRCDFDGDTDLSKYLRGHTTLGRSVLRDLPRQCRVTLGSQHAGPRWLEYDATVVEAVFAATMAARLRAVDEARGRLRTLADKIESIGAEAARLQRDIDGLQRDADGTRASKRRCLTYAPPKG
ncbi:hypothetical protein GGR56DRAFT_152882 [Xylariaceae sp. FL0804]|nr:hypothetical protein GGR56DRAFT_152882 [Xylariaceae sp. FL0804]